MLMTLVKQKEDPRSYLIFIKLNELMGGCNIKELVGLANLLRNEH